MNRDALEVRAARDPLRRSLQIGHAEDFVPLGIELRIETNSPIVLDAARSAFGRYRLDGRGRRLNQRFLIRLLEDPGFSESPPWTDPVYRGQGHIFYASVGSQNAVLADLERRFAFGFISPAMVRDTGFLQRNFLEGLVFTMATHGPGATHTYVHASAVSKGDAGLIFSGPSGSGKSTLAFACARRGFNVVTDDVVYLNNERNCLKAWGRPWQMRVSPDCGRFFPELMQYAQAAPNAGTGVIDIDVEDLFPSQARAHCQPVGLFFLDRTPSGPVACEPLEPDKAVELLARDLIQDEQAVLERHVRSWYQLAQKGSYILRCGEDLDSVVVLLERFVQRGGQA